MYYLFFNNLIVSFLADWESFEPLLKFLYAFQPEIYTLAKRDYDNIRTNAYLDARPLKAKIISFLIETGKIEILNIKGRCILFNTKTFEFRYFNSSLNVEILNTYFRFVFGLRDYILSHEEKDVELLDYYFKKALKRNDDLTLSRTRYRTMQNILNI